MFFAGSVSMGKVAHFVPRPGEQLVIFGASLFGTRFTSIGAPGQKIEGDGEQQLSNEMGLFSRFAVARVDGICEVMQAIERAFEGETIQRGVMGDGGGLHERTDQS